MKIDVCFVGVGSIAKRHIRNLISVCEENKYELTIDVVSKSLALGDSDTRQLVRYIHEDINDINVVYDIVFITNPTKYHISTLKQVSDYGRSFFIEKPIAAVEQIDIVNKYDIKEDTIYYIACPLRYNSVIQYLKNELDISKVISVRCISSSYLPEWRPGQDYRSTYSAYKDMGGGVSIDLIHEWDYISYIFGMPKKVNYMGGKKSSLEIDSDDYAVYIAEYPNMIVELHLDYFGRYPMREIEIFLDDEVIRADILNGKIEYMCAERCINFEHDRDEYQKRELKHFLRMFEGKIDCDSDIKHAVRVLELTQGRIQ